MQMKAELRQEIKNQRRQIDNKAYFDEQICNYLKSSNAYKNTNTVLCYVALPNEINTDAIINQSIADNKTVAIPYCVDNNGNMEFYIIKSLNELEIGSFNIREPNIHSAEKISTFDNSIIIVPGLCFDKSGYRLGYGKGYYDRFLENNPLLSIGLCYNRFIKESLPTDKYDQRVDYVITEKGIIDCGGKNG